MRRRDPYDRMHVDMEDGMRRIHDDIEAGMERMGRDQRAAHLRHMRRMRDARRQAREARREARHERRGARSAQCGAYAAQGPWCYWWLIFPLVFWVLPSMGRHNFHWDHGGWGALTAAPAGIVGAWLEGGPAGWAIDRFSALTGLSQGDATGVLLAALAVNAAVIVFALRRGGRG